MSVTIEQKLGALLQGAGIEVVFDYEGEVHWGTTNFLVDKWEVSLFQGDEQFDLPYHKGLGLRNGCAPVDPTLAEVLACVLDESQAVDDTGDFEDWALELGYDTDSRAAEAIYNQCVKQFEGLKRVIDPDTWEALVELLLDFGQ